MALSEFVAMETAYRALQELDQPARRRAVHWLTDALSVIEPLPEAAAESPGVATSGPDEQSRVAPPARKAAGRRTGAARAAKKTGAAGRAAAPEEAPRGRRGRAAKVSAGAGQGERAYRRMPPAEDVLAAYRQVGTITGLAEHYRVPRHTVQSWARRLRRDGYQIGRTG